jgi:hypothetical protein
LSIRLRPADLANKMPKALAAKITDRIQVTTTWTQDWALLCWEGGDQLPNKTFLLIRIGHIRLSITIHLLVEGVREVSRIDLFNSIQVVCQKCKWNTTFDANDVIFQDAPPNPKLDEGGSRYYAAWSNSCKECSNKMSFNVEVCEDPSGVIRESIGKDVHGCKILSVLSSMVYMRGKKVYVMV